MHSGDVGMQVIDLSPLPENPPVQHTTYTGMSQSHNLWIDADAWVCSWDAIDLYFNACESGKLGITQTIGPGYKVL